MHGNGAVAAVLFILAAAALFRFCGGGSDMAFHIGKEAYSAEDSL